MIRKQSSSSEISVQRELLFTSVGIKGSGAMRYGAAMFLYNVGLVNKDMLEIYRICSKYDHENPLELAMSQGITLPNLDTKGTMEPTS
ncbi:MAG TPA: hypothetical protein DCE52_12520 [Rhodobacteraceae bacterium]|nr:hypothetical protein [Alphaproteobacteria bacterium]HAB38799.1 hypothetical protein [Paracoccaceae bacterium]